MILLFILNRWACQPMRVCNSAMLLVEHEKAAVAFWLEPTLEQVAAARPEAENSTR